MHSSVSNVIFIITFSVIFNVLLSSLYGKFYSFTIYVLSALKVSKKWICIELDFFIASRWIILFHYAVSEEKGYADCKYNTMGHTYKKQNIQRKLPVDDSL